MEHEPTRDEDESTIDKLRDSPVGTNDPNIVGDAGPTDVPPGTDGDPPAIPDEERVENP
jgi:hypothetical protein